jgi:hypothetical protein
MRRLIKSNTSSSGRPNRDVSHGFFLHCDSSSGKLSEFARKPPSFSAHEAHELAPPERFSRLAQRLFLRDADVLQKVKIVALSDLAQRAALA